MNRDEISSANAKRRATVIAPVAIAVLSTVWSERAQADEPLSPPPSVRQVLDEEARELKLRIEVEHLRRDLARTRREAATDDAQEPSGPRSPERASLLLPELFAVTTTNFASGPGTLVAVAAGPVSYGTFHDASTDVTAWTFAPSGALVVGRRFTVGGAAFASRQTAHSRDGLATESHTLALGPRVGVLIPVGSGLSLWPELGASFGVTRSESRQADAAPYRSLTHVVTPTASASLVIPIARNLFAAAGADVGVTIAVADGAGTSDSQALRLGSHLRLGLAL